MPACPPNGVCRPEKRSAYDGAATGEAGAVAEFFLDPQQLVVLGHALGARGRTGLDLAGARGDDEVREQRVLGLPGAVRDETAVAGLACDRHRLERLRQRPDLVELDQDRVRDARLDPA